MSWTIGSGKSKCDVEIFMYFNENNKNHYNHDNIPENVKEEIEEVITNAITESIEDIEFVGTYGDEVFDCDEPGYLIKATFKIYCEFKVWHCPAVLYGDYPSPEEYEFVLDTEKLDLPLYKDELNNDKKSEILKIIKDSKFNDLIKDIGIVGITEEDNFIDNVEPDEDTEPDY